MTNSSLFGVNKDGNNKITVVQTEKPPYKQILGRSLSKFPKTPGSRRIQSLYSCED